MKRAALCLTVFLISFGGLVLEERPNPVLINGKPFANAYNINGVIAISVADFTKAVGGTTKLQGNTLVTSPRDPASGLPTGKRMHKPFVITKEANVSTNVLWKGGKAFVSLADVAKAFGGVFNQPPLRAGQPISLNFTVNANSILEAQ
jgi:hypothetical protein